MPLRMGCLNDSDAATGRSGEDEMDETVKCKRCGKDTDALAVFPGTICLACYEAKEGKAPLTQADFDGMVRTFSGRK